MFYNKLRFPYLLKHLRFNSRYIYSSGFESSLVPYEKFHSVFICKDKNEKEQHEKQEKEDYWKGNRFHNIENNFRRVLRFIPVYILLSLLGIQEVSCREGAQEDTQIEENFLDLTETAQKLEDKAKSGAEQKKAQITKKNKAESDSKEENKASSEVKKEDKFNSINSDINLSDSETKTSNSDSKSCETNAANEPKPLPNFRTFSNEEFISVKRAIDLSRNAVLMNKSETGSPGISVAVSLNGKLVWAEGIGYADLENGTRMTPYTVMRIASISKSITMVAVGKLVEEGKLDLDAPIQKYVASFPKKIVNGEEVTITTRHLLNHTSGIRHYKLKEEVKSSDEDKNKEKSKAKLSVKKEKKNLKKVNDSEDDPKSVEGNIKTESHPELTVEEKREKIRNLVAEKILKRKVKENPDEFDLEEYYIKEEFDTIEEALKLFKDDDLLFKPGEKYYYSTHGYTLVSAVVEAVAKKPFHKVITELFEDLALKETYLDRNDSIIYRRGRYYVRNKKGLLENAPYVDNSYKWAGGGFVSNVSDLTKFGNMMLYSFQNLAREAPEGFLKSSIVKEMWTDSVCKSKNSRNGSYGLGWRVVEGDRSPKAYSYFRKFFASHTGGAVGASSALLVMPSYDPYEKGNVMSNEVKVALPQGIVVAIITNMQGVGLQKLAVNIANIFDRVHHDPKIVGSTSSPGGNKVYTLERS